jgi:hypothetical protein
MIQEKTLSKKFLDTVPFRFRLILILCNGICLTDLSLTKPFCQSACVCSMHWFMRWRWWVRYRRDCLNNFFHASDTRASSIVIGVSSSSSKKVRNYRNFFSFVSPFLAKKLTIFRNVMCFYRNLKQDASFRF